MLTKIKTNKTRSLANAKKSWPYHLHLKSSDLSEVRQFLACYVNKTLSRKLQSMLV